MLDEMTWLNTAGETTKTPMVNARVAKTPTLLSVENPLCLRMT